MLRYLGEIDCIEDLIDMVGEDASNKAWHGKLNYFKDISSGNIFGVSDFQADYIFENEEVVAIDLSIGRRF